MEKIFFYQGEESIVVHENYVEKDTSLFREQYKKAFSEIDAFLDAPDKLPGMSNIFVFAGERGAGKTSCMLSVAEMLPECRKDKAKNKSFHCAPLIDPSFFDSKNNILEILLGKFFAEFEKDIKKEYQVRDEQYPSKKNHLLKMFECVRSCVSHLSVQANQIDIIDQLPELAASMELSSLFKELIDAYLEYFGKEVLVIPIDDIDLHSSQANVMAEQIRKYLMHSNVIVLIALKVEQLQLIKEKDFINQFSNLIEKGRVNIADIIDMSSKYLTKLIPLNHRIYLPTMETIDDVELVLMNNREEKKVIQKGSSVKYTVTALIFRKCRYLFYHTKGTTSPIVPRNLRELRHLIGMLASMTDYRKSWDEYNKVLFEQYLYDTWVTNNLNAGDVQIAYDVKNLKDVSTFNKNIIQILSSKYSKLLNIIKEDKNSEIYYILADDNVAYNLSIGDVFVVIDYLKKRVNDIEDRMFLFFIVTIYSMKLYAYYDKLTEPITHEHIPANANIDVTIKKKELFDEIPDYQAFVAGNLMNVRYFNLLPVEEATKLSRTQRPIALKILRQIISSLPTPPANLSEEQLHQLYLAEFFALTLSRRYNSKNSNMNLDYRKSDELYYSSGFGSSTVWAIYDIGALFNNIIDIDKTYIRLMSSELQYSANRLLDIAKAEPESIYNKIKSKSLELGHKKEDEDTIPLHSLRSWCIVRNAEILEDFVSSISYNMQRGSSAINRLNIIELLGKMASYQIKTYDKDDNIPYTIQFDYINCIKESLSKVNDADFDAIYVGRTDSLSSFDVDYIISNFKRNKTYAQKGVMQKISGIFKEFFITHPDVRNDLYEQITNPTYNVDQLKELLTNFKENYVAR